MSKQNDVEIDAKTLTLGDAIGTSLNPVLAFITDNLDKTPRELATITNGMSLDEVEALVFSCMVMQFQTREVVRGMLKSHPDVIPRVIKDAVEMNINLMEILT